MSSRPVLAAIRKESPKKALFYLFIETFGKQQLYTVDVSNRCGPRQLDAENRIKWLLNTLPRFRSLRARVFAEASCCRQATVSHKVGRVTKAPIFSIVCPSHRQAVRVTVLFNSES